MANNADTNSFLELEELKKECEHLRQKESSSSNERAQLEQECMKLREKLTEMTKEAAIAREEMENGVHHVDRATANLNLDNFAHAQDLPASSAPSIDQRYLARIEDLEKENERLRQEAIAATESVRRHLSESGESTNECGPAAASGKSVDLEKECTRLREQLTEATNELDSAQKEVERRIRQSVVDSANLKAVSETLKVQMSTAAATSTRERAIKKSNTARIEELENENDQLRQDYAMAIEASKNHLTDVEKLKSECENLRQHSVAAVEKTECEGCDNVSDHTLLQAKGSFGLDVEWAKLVDDIQSFGQKHAARLEQLASEPEVTHLENLRRICDEMRKGFDASWQAHVEKILELQRKHSAPKQDFKSERHSSLTAVVEEQATEIERLQKELALSTEALKNMEMERSDELQTMQKEMDRVCNELKAVRIEQSSAAWFFCGR
eukprot:TRINITY_DN14022_c0_g1_i1.p1 TRINITY_DN14022_c0_g1~~TRINITY_DN14022_c0_g1_i1.p1  ORF type:complete len:441 (+),score=97.99 TRINITY_DN14022_c0_g1_i1:84-1406(+)